MKNDLDMHKNLKFDSRMLEINLKNGSLKKEELAAHLNSLPDCSDNAESINIEGNDEDISEENLN